ncbi:MAG: tRNA (adenosine(37)-N6)-dimethylallyltransferase MiaA [Gammaproteobacteria bacterium]|nr:tRNA (adenosine(37)-N6)-dimethylallyltransferase MiaA [Gammaproteobacteria bacterium]
MPLPVIFLMGPTATGKTDLAAALHDAYQTDLISVDAVQVYRGMDIGSGKPGAAFLRKHPHALIDIRAPSETYNAAQFCEDALGLIAESHARGRLPILVGGTMFYFAALEHGLSELPGGDAAARAEIAREMEELGAAAMHAKLREVDARLAGTIRPSDPQRISRALEIHRLSGRPPSEVMAENAGAPLPFPLVKLGLFFGERKKLHARIETRFQKMLERGLVEEVRELLASAEAAGESPQNWASLRAVGYRQTIDFLRGEFSGEELHARGAAATRQLAKRQLTWMRRQPELVWLEAEGALEKARAHLDAREELAEFRRG